MASPAHPYDQWSSEELVSRVIALENQLKESSEKYGKDTSSSRARERQAPSPSSRPAKKPRTFNWSKYSTRLIALKFAYLGGRYNGFEHHANNSTPLPTVEEKLWQALMKGKLINPTGDSKGPTDAVNWEGCDYSKCGRTDRGVSAFGQVIALRVRSNRPISTHPDPLAGDLDSDRPDSGEEPPQEDPQATQPRQLSAFDDQTDELQYIRTLNTLLPPDIRVLAWCPSPPEDFSARFSCRARHYKYYFTQPSFSPTPGDRGLRHGLTSSTTNDKRREGWLDIDRMQQAAERFEGLHDFRNFCKIDPGKQISDYRRRIFRAEIRALSPEEEPAAYISGSLFTETSASHDASHTGATTNVSTPKTYVFDLQGSAFLWHQVRHMIAVLFLVGQGLESPDVIDHLLNITSCPEKPSYEMADEAPLVLWNCTFPNVDADPLTDSLNWVYVGDTPSRSSTTSLGPPKPLRGSSIVKYGLGGAVDEAWNLWRAAHMDAILRGSLVNLLARQPDVLARDPAADPAALGPRPYHSQKVFQGAANAVYRGKYVPLLERERMKSVEVANREYAEKHGLPDKKARDDSGGHAREARGDHA